MIYSYARSLKNEQDLDTQTTALQKFGVDELYIEKATDKKTVHENLNKIFSQLKNGDVFVICKLDYLDRTVKQLFILLNEFERNNISFVSIGEKIDTKQDKEFITNLSILAKMNKKVTSERTKEGMFKTKKKGSPVGRKPLPQKKVKKIIELYYDKNMSISEIEKKTGISRPTLYKYICLNDKNKEEEGESK